MSSTTQTLEHALIELPAKLRVHEVAKRAGLTSKEVLAALSAAGVKAASAASSISAADATVVLTTLLGGDPAPAEVDQSGVPAAEPVDEPGPAAGRSEPDPGFFAAPLFLPPAATAPARRRRSAKAPEPTPEPSGPADIAAIGAADVGDLHKADAIASAESTMPAEAAEAGTAESGTGTGHSGRRRRGRSGGRGRGPADEATAELPIAELTTTELSTTELSAAPTDGPAAASPSAGEPSVDSDQDDDDDQARRRRRRGRRGRGRVGDERADEAAESTASDDAALTDAALIDTALTDAALIDGELIDGGLTDAALIHASAEDSQPAVEDETDEEIGDDDAGDEHGTRRRRRRRRRGGAAEPVGDGGTADSDPGQTVVHVREPRPPRETTSSNSDVQGIRGSTRLEAKRQRRRDSHGSRNRPQILTEAEFLARREAVDRVMAVRQRGDLAQVALLEDGILVEHFVSLAGSESLMGNIYLGKVQNVLPSMEAAFVDIGKGRNAVLYAGEVNWDAAGLAGKARRIETALSGGDTILVQVSKDPVGQKGARLTTQISLPGRFLVYVPGGGATGISRKLPDTERKRLKSILDRIVPEDAGVIIRTAAEGVAEEELARDVDRLKSQWDAISAQAAKKGSAPLQLSAEPDTLIKVIRDLFNSDISRLVLDGERAYEPVAAYIEGVAPELADRVSRYDGPNDVFTAYRIDEQIAKALERKVYLPSGGSLVIDRTEAMTVVDVNTGKYTGSGGNLEETVTRNNLEAAEEVVRQLRLRDIGGIIVVDFIDMVLESNRELVMRRLTECLGRDRTRHQVAEVTSLGLIQMTRKKMGTGLVEAFSEPCPHCQGRGILLHDVPMEDRSVIAEEDTGKSRRRGRGRQEAAPEPELIKLVQATVRPPDPRGPKPPTRTGEIADEGDAAPAASHQAPSAPVTTRHPGAHADAGSGASSSSASFNAPRSRDASDAVSAVLAALDAQTARQAGSRTEAGTPDTSVSAGDSAPAGGRRRGRRAAGRPAGAPTPPLVADAAVVDDPSVDDASVNVASLDSTFNVASLDSTLLDQTSVDGTSVVDVAAVDAPGVDDPEVDDTEVVDTEVDDTQVDDAGTVDAAAADQETSALGQAESGSVDIDLAATDPLTVPDVQAQEPDALDVPIVEPVRASRPPRRRAGRAAGAAVPAVNGSAPNGSADSSGAENGSADSTSAENGSADSTSAESGSAESGSDPERVGATASNGDAGANDVTASPTKPAAPRRRRAASRPAGAPIKQ